MPGQECATDDPEGDGDVHLESGEYTLREDDLRVRSVGFDFVFRRSYASRDRVQDPLQSRAQEHPLPYGAFGWGQWTHSYEIWLETVPNAVRIHNAVCGWNVPGPCWLDTNSYRVFDGTGRSDIFTKVAYYDGQQPNTGNLVVPMVAFSGGREAYLVDNHDPAALGELSTFTMIHRDGTKWTFREMEVRYPDFLNAPHHQYTTSARLESVQDKNGNTMTFTYSGGQIDEETWEPIRLAKIHDTLEREYVLDYHDSGQDFGQLKSVTDFSGRTVEYDYTGENETPPWTLRSVRSPTVVDAPVVPGSAPNDFPAGRTRTYTYAPRGTSWDYYNLESIMDANGRLVVENEYTTSPNRTVALPCSSPHRCPDGYTDCGMENLAYDRVVAQRRADGGTTHYAYTRIKPVTTETCDRAIRTVLTDPEGNVSVHDFDAKRLPREVRRYTGRASTDRPARVATLIDGSIQFVDNPPLNRLRDGSLSGLSKDPDHWLTHTIFHPHGGLWRRSEAAVSGGVAHGGRSEELFYSDVGNWSNAPTCPSLLGEAVPSWCENVPDVVSYPCHGGKPRRIKIEAAGDQPCTYRRFVYDTDPTHDFRLADVPPVPLFESKGLLRGEYDPNGILTRHDYDERGNRITTRVYAGSDTVSRRDFEYDHGAPEGPGHLTALVHAEDGEGRRQRDEYEYYGDAECPDPDDETNRFCWMRGYLARARVDAGGLDLVTTYEYDRRGNIARIDGPGGSRVEFAHNELDQLMKQSVWVTLHDGTVTRYDSYSQYDAANRLVRSDVVNVDENGVTSLAHPAFTTVKRHDARGRVVLVLQEIDDVPEQRWDALLAAASGEDLDAVLTSFGLDDRLAVTRMRHDRNGNLVRTERPEAMRYILSGGLVGQKHQVESRQYDERDLLYRVITAPGHPDQITQQLDYDGNREVIRRWGPLELPYAQGSEVRPRLVQSLRDGYGRVTDEISPNGTASHHGYDANGNRMTTTVTGTRLDASGTPSSRCLAMTRMRYDALGRPWQAEAADFDPAVHATCPPAEDVAWRARSRGYSHRGQVLWTQDEIGRRSATTYDTAGRLETTKDPVGSIVEYAYDGGSNVIGQAFWHARTSGGAPRYSEMKFTVDELGRRLTVVDEGQHVTRARFDSRGNLVHATDGRGNVVTHVHDGLSRLVETHRELRDGGTGAGALLGHVVTSAAWDASSRLMRQKDGAGAVTSYEHDPLDRVRVVTMGDLTRHHVAFDAFSHKTKVVDANGTEVAFVNDPEGRLLERKVLVAGPTTAVPVSKDHYRYDGLGRLVRAWREPHPAVSDPVALLRREYDSRGLLLREDVDGRELTFVYDVAGGLQELTHPSGRRISLVRDVGGRVSDIHDGSGITESCDVPAPPASCILHQDFVGSLLERRDWANGTYQVRAYVGEPMPIALSTWGPEGLLDLQSNNWDASHNRTRRGHTGVIDDRRYAYDSLSQLVSANHASGADAVSFALDAAGNRTEVVGGSFPGLYLRDPDDGPVNQYTWTPSHGLTHDANGNQTWLQWSGRNMELQYDSENLLVRAYEHAGGPTPAVAAEYYHDSLGRRIGKSVAIDGGAPVETWYSYAGDQIVEMESDGVLTTRAFGGLYPDDVVAYDRGGERWFVHSDDQFSTRLITDHLGAVVERMTYSDFGDPTVHDADGVPVGKVSLVGNTSFFTGHAHDPETGFYAMRARYLDPVVGRFITRDPLGIWADAINLGNGYTYAGNNPATNVDPTGMLAWRRDAHEMATVSGSEEKSEEEGEGDDDSDSPDDTEDEDEEQEEDRSLAERVARWVNERLNSANEGDAAKTADEAWALIHKVFEPAANLLPGETVEAVVTEALTEDADRSTSEAGQALDEVGSPNRTGSYNEVVPPIAGKLAGDAANAAVMLPVGAIARLEGPDIPIDAKQQARHVPGTSIEGRSILTADPKRLSRAAGMGEQVGSTKVGYPGSKERVSFSEPIGYYVDRASGMLTPTSNAMIHYSSTGIHIVPARP